MIIMDKVTGLTMDKLVQLSCLMLTSFLLLNSNSFASTSALDDISFSLFAEGGETESVFVIDGRSFPVKIGSVGLRASISPSEHITAYTKIGIGYSQKQNVSAYGYDLNGSVFATSIGVGVNRKFRIGDSSFSLIPFLDLNSYNYSSDAFRGSQNGEPLKATVKGNSSFYRTGLELQYETHSGHFFFGTGLNNWDIANEISVKTEAMTITPKVWADNTDSFLQLGFLFETGNGNGLVGMRVSDLTFDVNTQLIETFAEFQISFGKK